MADVVDAETRSRMMSGIRARDTKIERIVRTELHALGFRYRLGGANLPGKPDIVLPKHRAVIFVHGCFWHGHGCHLFRWPKTRADFWRQKIGANRERDGRNLNELKQLHWRAFVIWECSIRGAAPEQVREVIRSLAKAIRIKRDVNFR